MIQAIDRKLMNEDTEPPKGVQGWDYNTEYTGEWKKKGYKDDYH